MPELLIELFCEEIPARMQADACLALRRLMDDKLKAAGFSPEGSESHVTPRRLVYTVPDLPSRQADVSEERKGPRVGAPQKALDGFLRATGLTQADLQVKDDPKGGFYVAKIERRGRPTGEVIGEALHQTVMTFPWPKSMRWGDGELRWVRPLHSVVCLFGGTIIDPHLEGVTSSDRTVGHRFLSPGAISVTGFDAYKQSLEKAYVLLDLEARREAIKEASHRLAAEAGLTVVDDPGLLEEVCGLVEWPVVLLGGFEEAFLDVPEEVLMTSMRSHQKYFSCRSASTGALANRFVFVSNIQTADNGAEIVKGNERVLRARLSDAQFFWDEDRKTPLEDRLVALKPMVFHARLGSVYDKAERMAVLARHLAPMLGGDERHAERAAQLAKADLATDMVFEFPELQGVMGAYYARHGGEEADIAQAIGAHYSPAGPSDDVPTQPTAIAVALADKLDTLTGFWAIDETPTGSKDPYALRRAALGVIRIVLENALRLDLT
ncbi:MAG: glycine--tRNA ligase subunit beta, partial [Pseudomonadota bacterium]